MRTLLIAALCLLALPCHAQITPLVTCSGTTSSCFCTGGSGCTTGGGFNGIGATLIKVTLAITSTAVTTGTPPLATGNPVVITDSSGNPYYCATNSAPDTCGYGADNKGVVIEWYTFAPVTTSNMTFTCASEYCTMWVEAFSGTATNACVLDTYNGQYCGDSVTSCQPGAITPAGNGELLSSSASSQSNITGLAINDSFNLTGYEPSSVNSAGGIAYLVDSVHTSINPTWTWTSGAQRMGAGITAYKPVALCNPARLRGYVIHSK